MDPITQAILLGIAGNFATDAVKTAYKALLDAFNSKFGQNSNVVKAVNELSAKPDSEGRKLTVQEEIAASKANDDAQLVQLAQKVIDLVKEQPGGEKVINTVTQKVNKPQQSPITGQGNPTINYNIPEN